MMQRWNVSNDSLEIREMPFYWRLGVRPAPHPAIPERLPFRVRRNEQFDYIQYEPTDSEWKAIDTAYRQNENIGFVNPESGQIHTYGSSVNMFFGDVIARHKARRVYEIGCGAGFSIQYLAEKGWQVTGIDPSEYSLQWSKRLGFSLLNRYFDGELLSEEADLIYCNDVFEHIPRVEVFSRNVWKALAEGGVFCFSTTNSTQSIAIGDISMFEHQHVNMFTIRAIHQILTSAGFSDIEVGAGSYGNTFHVVARKRTRGADRPPLPEPVCEGYVDRAAQNLRHFERFHDTYGENCQYYVPLRCIPYLAAVGDFGSAHLFDSNPAWRGKYIDGYDKPIQSAADIRRKENDKFFIGSMTFHREIKEALMKLGYAETDIFSVGNLRS
jgi:2-polyprenyl-3-methyl-5-hydroxy-6-metoxy-1,4-benzoquinol methylase